MSFESLPWQYRPRKPLKRKTPLAKRSKNPEKRKRSEIPHSVRKAVKERSQGQCEARESKLVNGNMISYVRCINRADDMHHVLPRSRGGKHVPENILHLCRFPHHDLCKRDPKKAKEMELLK